MSKYFKLNSLTWWSGVFLLGLAVVESIQQKAISPMVAEALAIIGFRVAIKPS